ncbi:MAG: GatB/YqeY domain-containing protein [Gammaproteobacteria bacterium]|nr:GatB/YqeY domain-containing protein [Gammaproteobacteria bacterium]MDH5614555.1 GatB/YqeY domain-containing protein [Gammaproteobacteria bacterium]
MSNPSSGLKARITEDMKTAMRSKDKERLAVIRLVQAAIKQREVDERIELDDAQVLAVLEKMLKQRRDSIEQFRKGEREDLAAIEEFEIGILQDYMPEALSEEEIDTIISEAISATGASSIKDMGKVMGQVKPKIQGRADMGAVSQKIKNQLG